MTSTDTVNVGDSIAGDSYTVQAKHVGGFSEVLIVEEWTGGLRRAMKRIRSDRWASIADKRGVTRQFLDEMLVWQTKLRGCPNTVEALMTFPDFFGLGPVAFMDVVDGPSLAALRSDCVRLSLRQTVRLAGQIAAALQYAHDKGVVHRDLTPSNVLLTRTNDVRVIDWGLASVRGAAGQAAFTPGYASPQREVQPDLNAPSDDVYAFGVLMHECLTGALPHRRKWEDAEVRDGLAAAGVTAPEAIADCLTRCLRRTPGDRPDFAEIATVLADATLVRDLRKWELETPYCKRCDFVTAANAPQIGTCPICDAPLWRRHFREPAPDTIRIQAGTFTAGLSHEQLEVALGTLGTTRMSAEDREEIVGKGHRRVFVPAFDIDRCPVTNAQYHAFCVATSYPTHESLADKVQRIPDHPVVNVSWKDALCYALWAGRRLPAPSEWERAARGDKGTQKYPWGDVWKPRVCNDSTYVKETKTTPVTTFVAPPHDGTSPFGVADMVGNVREWVQHGVRGGMKGLMGGAWSEPCVFYGLVSRVTDADVNFEDEATGFRCAADPSYVERPLNGSD